MKKKKLLFFGPANSPHLQSWATFDRPDFEIEVLTFHAPTPEQNYKNCKVTVLKGITKTKLDYVLCTSSVQKFVDQFKPDCIHAHYASSYGLICSNLKTPALKVLSAWGSDLNHARKNPVHRFFIDRSLLKFDWINVPSDNLKSLLLKIGVNEKKILVFQYGTDLSFCDSLKPEKKKTDEVVILSSRLWAPLYNIDKIIEAFKLARKKNPKLKLVLTGSGTTEENEKINALISNDPAISSHGFIPKAELVKLLWEADIYISVPISDGMSLSVLEALYCECYPIFSDIPPNREILNYCEGKLALDLDSVHLSQDMIEAAEKFRQTELSKNVQFIDTRANYQKNMEKIGTIYSSGKSL
jgi:glycosyltransferase involved in cell wall biosynthesis